MAEFAAPLAGVRRWDIDSSVVGGGVAGIIGGCCMGILATIYAGLSGAGASLPWENIAAMFYGPLAYVGNGGIVVIGVLVHLAVSAGFGAFYAVLIPRTRVLASLWIGAVYGLAVWAFMTWVMLPVFDATMSSRVALTPAWWFFLHLVYGSVLGLATPGLCRAAGYPAARTPAA